MSSMPSPSEMDRGDLEDEVEANRQAIESLTKRVEALEDEEQSSVQWEGSADDPSSIRFIDTENDGMYPLGRVLVGKASNHVEDEIDRLWDDVQKLKRGEIDREDLVGGAGIEAELPIEEDVAKSLDKSRRGDLSANEHRAAHIFRAFGGHCESWSGVLKITSADVRNIFESTEQLQNEPNTNTVKRAMKMLAKKTRDVPKNERDPYHEDNLLRIKKGQQRLELVADKDEWHTYWDGVEDRVNDLVAGGETDP